MYIHIYKSSLNIVDSYSINNIEYLCKIVQYKILMMGKTNMTILFLEELSSEDWHEIII